MKKASHLFLMLISILMLVPQVWSHENVEDKGLGTREDQLRLIGNVTVRSTLSGHVTVAAAHRSIK